MKNGSKADHQSNRLLATLDAEDFLWLKPHLEVVEMTKGEVIYEAGETIGHTYFPHNTIISLLTILKDGGSVEVAAFGRESVFGFISALISRRSFGRYLVQYPGMASRIAVERLHEAVGARPKIRRMLLGFTEALLVQSLQTVACNAAHSVEARCCRWILSTYDRIEKDTLPLTHELLATMLGVQRSTVTSTTRALQTAGLITQGRGSITITDHAGIERAACECYHVIRRKFDAMLSGGGEKN
jgi:CRP-like cAMP-binding protein